MHVIKFFAKFKEMYCLPGEQEHLSSSALQTNRNIFFKETIIVLKHFYL